MAGSVEMKVVAIDPLDNFDDFTVPVDQWLGRDSYERFTGDKVAAYTEAFAAVSRHPLWDGRLRHMPAVAYNPARDSGYFIFKIDNNGTTFLVGLELPEVDEELGFFVGGRPNVNSSIGGAK